MSRRRAKCIVSIAGVGRPRSLVTALFLNAVPRTDQARMTAFVQGLAQLDWLDGRNARIDTRPVRDL